MTPGADPLLVACPVCEAGIREPCFARGTGRDLPKAHAKRVKLADERAEAARRRAEGDAEARITEPRWRRLYAAARLELEGRADWSPLAAEQLETVVRNMAAADAARKRAEENPTVGGSTGQPVANPAAALALRYDAQALATARALKLTPDTRGASAPPTEVPDVEDDRPPEERDELAELDDLALRRKAKAAKSAKAKAKPRARR